MKISEGQVLVALKAFYNEPTGDWSEEDEDAMRAALEVAWQFQEEEA